MHTEGKIRVGFKGWNAKPVVYVDEDSYPWVIAEMSNPPKGNGDMKANAHLYATAPTMARVLRELVVMVQNDYEKGSIGDTLCAIAEQTLVEAGMA